MDDADFIFDKYRDWWEYYPVPHETVSKFTSFYQIFQKWSSSINLTAEPDNFWERHLLDSLILLPHLPAGSEILDIGTGGGFPGLVLALTGKYRMHLIDSDKRKMLFAREVCRITHTEAEIYTSRVETLSGKKFPYIVSRACAPLEKLLMLALPLMKKETQAFFHKGARVEEEIAEASKYWIFNALLHHPHFRSDTYLLQISGLRPK